MNPIFLSKRQEIEIVFFVFWVRISMIWVFGRFGARRKVFAKTGKTHFKKHYIIDSINTIPLIKCWEKLHHGDGHILKRTPRQKMSYSRKTDAQNYGALMCAPKNVIAQNYGLNFRNKQRVGKKGWQKWTDVFLCFFRVPAADGFSWLWLLWWLLF